MSFCLHVCLFLDTVMLRSILIKGDLETPTDAKCCTMPDYCIACAGMHSSSTAPLVLGTN